MLQVWLCISMTGGEPMMLAPSAASACASVSRREVFSRGVRRWESKKKKGHQFNTRALSDLATAPLSQSHWEFGLRAPDLARSLQRHVSQSVGLLLPIPNWNGCYCSQYQFGALVHWRYSLRLSHKVWRPLSVWSPYVTSAN